MTLPLISESAAEATAQSPVPARVKATKSTAGRALRSYLRPRWKGIAGAAGLFSGHQLGEAMVPVLIGLVVDHAIRVGAGSDLLAGRRRAGIPFPFTELSVRCPAQHHQ
ncbi:hypothetical protein RSal33209_0456 [Renibacterium salmoninarum ATCC 33209]|uniref:Uncharacterized protein n=1 Tax=Renibacterium salmoninarum (strain ATCC 33209 / DSM 20767 / JCM 11484 / NBRC 15589 / NCIMB 2235) TaxID=288705 RepID=A9WM74_RENSM|nr:hypothetical protein [Renibacterium salmoninarum]ABY22206.1 hypothetical protein RSal33209_0456 [Renibacterium salmoninarum ATCC 33209]